MITCVTCSTTDVYMGDNVIRRKVGRAVGREVGWPVGALGWDVG